MRVLLVNYDADTREALESILRDEGWETSAVSTIADGMLALRGDPVDVVLLCQQRPDLRFAREFITAQHGDGAIPAPPLILTTAFLNPPERMHGVFRVVPAPFDIEVIVQAIRDASRSALRR